MMKKGIESSDCLHADKKRAVRDDKRLWKMMSSARVNFVDSSNGLEPFRAMQGL